MERVLRRSWLRSAWLPSVALLALIVVLGVGGYLLTSSTIRRDRDEAASRRALVETVHTQEVLGRARAYVAGLAGVLATEPRAGQARFARWAAGTAASVGLDDVLWVERVARAERARYERRLGAPIAWLTSFGRFVRAPETDSYLPATYTSMTRPELRPGVDVTGFPGLGEAIRNRASIFAVGASAAGSLGSEPGFYLVEAARFGRGPGSRGYLAAFVPRGWFTTSLGGDPRRVAISLDGRRVEGDLDSVDASAEFETLGRRWRIDVAREPPTELQSTLPWLALAWPFAAAAIVVLIVRAIAQRRRAQRDVERIFELSLDLVGIAGYDGRYRAVNPAFERTLGYPREEFLSRPLTDFVHPDDVESTRAVFAALSRGEEVAGFENRLIRADGAERWLQWNARAVPGQDVIYGIARDVTERRRVDAEQAALRRVATLVARDVPPAEIFQAVAEEIAAIAPTDVVHVLRYEEDGTAVPVASWSGLPDGASLEPPAQDGIPATVLRTSRAARSGSAVGSPIAVEGRLWGVVVAGMASAEPIPADTERRIAGFTELVATAIANAEGRAQLAASRARVVAATTEERRRIVRDLHDGAQQRLVHAVVTLKLALQELESGDGNVEALVREALDEATGANSELRELVHGILPSVLTKGGLRAAVEALVERNPLEVTVDVSPERLPSAIEATAYFFVSEALTNALKHADARGAEVTAHVKDGGLRVEVRDDGAGGADPRRGSGLTGLRDRVEALGGTIEIRSPRGGGTSVVARIPVGRRG
jgi:PAS domain S-box-containing protein